VFEEKGWQNRTKKPLDEFFEQAERPTNYGKQSFSLLKEEQKDGYGRDRCYRDTE
jgi:hypothetical protein